MTDRELLEAAAKAAGYVLEVDGDGELYRLKDSGVRDYRSPLDDDGAALRLAVRLNMDVKCYASLCEVFYGSPRTMAREDGGSFKAARRAIVRAAAAMAA